jgi:uncharacterized membrane protein HdeD (DUF308 family)
MPIATIPALVLLFSAYMIVDGAFAIYAAVRAARQREGWSFLARQGITSVAAGVIAFVWPGLTVLAYTERGTFIAAFEGASRRSRLWQPRSRPSCVIG